MTVRDAMATTRSRRPWRRRTVVAMVALGVALLIGANAHFVYVAFTSQPDCVPHAKEVGIEGAPMRAARSAC